jgi:septal ring factor EnvC (AmiA/AmiB activator)
LPLVAAKVKSDYGLLSQLSTAVTSATKQYRELQKAHDQLTVLLDRAEQERSALATAFAGRSKVLAELEAKLNDSCQYSKGLQAKLDDAAKTCDTLAGELKTVKAELLGQVGAAQDAVLEEVAVPSVHCHASLRLKQGALADALHPVSPHSYTTLLQAEARQEAELMAEKVARELTAVQTEKATLAEQLNTSTAMVETLTEELGRQSTKLAVVEEAKVGAQVATFVHAATCQKDSHLFEKCTLQAALEAAIHEREAEAQQLAEQLTQAMAAAKKAEVSSAAFKKCLLASPDA